LQKKNVTTTNSKKMTKKHTHFKLLTTILFVITLNYASAQQNIFSTISFAENQFSHSIGYEKFYGLGKSKKMLIGFGGRLTSSFQKNNYFTTAPAKLTSGKTGPAVLFAEDIISNIDSLLISKTNTFALNASINLGYKVNEKLTIGFNIDALGLSFGSKQNATFFGNNNQVANTTAKPTTFNALLISDNDRGSLNSELYANYHIKNNWSVRAGVQYLFTEYTTATQVQTAPNGIKNDRFRNTLLGFEIGITKKL
jgi:hypothetical protein